MHAREVWYCFLLDFRSSKFSLHKRYKGTLFVASHSTDIVLPLILPVPPCRYIEIEERCRTRKLYGMGHDDEESVQAYAIRTK
jgi:hypothetical protein